MRVLLVKDTVNFDVRQGTVQHVFMIQDWQKTVTAGGLALNAVDKTAFAEMIEIEAKKSPHAVTIATPNAEIMELALRNPEYYAVLAQMSHRICDSFGLELLTLLCKGRRPTRITGVDFVETLAALAAKQQWQLILLGDTAEANQEASTVLAERHGCKTISIPAGTMGATDTPPELAAALSEPSIILVALGMGKQENWILAHAQIPQAKIMIGIGGALRMIAGLVPRAPSWMRTCGLEWLWRWHLEPGRWKRMLTALLVFPYRFLRYELLHRAPGDSRLETRDSTSQERKLTK